MEKLGAAKDRLVDTIKDEKNMIPFLVEAVKSGMTRGEYARIKSEMFNQPGEGPYLCSPPFVLA